MYLQDYNPAGSFPLSVLAAAAPVLTLLYLLALHPSRGRDGSLHLGVPAHWAAAAAGVVALVVAVFVFGMPASSAGMSMVYGALYGLLPIGWIIVGAMFLYTVTLVSGQFDVLKASVASLSDDRRIQAILIAFSFGAFIEGAAGFGTPVAIAGALLVGLGFKPLQAAILCLIANTAPVAYGGLGTPITALSAVTDIDAMTLSKMAARQLPFFSVIVPVWMTAVQVKMDGRGWRQGARDVLAVWPVLLVAGVSFGVTQFLVGNFVNHLLVDILGGGVSMASVALFCTRWKPKTPYVVGGGADVTKPAPATGGSDDDMRDGPPAPAASAGNQVLDYAGPTKVHSSARVLLAWLPWALLTSFVLIWGLPPVKKRLEAMPGAAPVWKVPRVDNVVYRTPPVVAEKKPDPAQYKIAWLTSPGTAALAAGLLSALLAGLTGPQWLYVTRRAAQRLSLPLLTICLILAMGFVTKYSGMDAVLGLAFTHTGWFYPFFAAMLGWLGVALTGSDTSSNMLFGSMQKIAAEQAGLNPVLITTANSTGGVMGKMIDAQSIVVATAACYESPAEGKLAVGPIFRGVLPHSVALAALMGVLVMLQAYAWPWMIPEAKTPTVPGAPPTTMRSVP